jgi:hypothetical protein
MFKDSELSVNDYFMGTDLSALAPCQKPTKPRLGHNPTVEEAREYAQKSEEYPKELEEWESAIAPIQAQIKARLDTPTAEARGILYSTRLFKRKIFRLSAQRQISPKALIPACPAVL